MSRFESEGGYGPRDGTQTTLIRMLSLVQFQVGLPNNRYIVGWSSRSADIREILVQFQVYRPCETSELVNTLPRQGSSAGFDPQVSYHARVVEW